MKKNIILILLLCVGKLMAQNVAVNNTNALASASAMLDLSSDTKDMLIPRMNSTARGIFKI